MRSIASALLSLLLVGSAHATELDGRWNWYYADFASPKIGSQVIVRHGTAQLKGTGHTIEVQFAETNAPDSHADFAGTIMPSGRVDGALRNLFPTGSELFGGSFSQQSQSGCILQKIALGRGAADSSVLVLARMQVDRSSRVQCPFASLATE